MIALALAAPFAVLHGIGPKTVASAIILSEPYDLSKKKELVDVFERGAALEGVLLVRKGIM